MVSGNVPATRLGTFEPVTETVSVVKPAPVIVAGLKLPVMAPTPPIVGLLVADKVTGELNPPAVRTFTVAVPVVTADVPVPNAGMLIGFGEATRLKEGAGLGAVGW
jgi:hypothetical protein